MKHVRIFFLLILATVFCAPLASSQSPGDFKIVDWNWSTDKYGYIRVNGEVRNVSRVAAGVELQLIFRNKSGQVVHSEEFWPASIKNIPAGGTWPVKYISMDVSGAETASMRVIGATVW